MVKAKQNQLTKIKKSQETLAKDFNITQGALKAERQTEMNIAESQIAPKKEELASISNTLDTPSLRNLKTEGDIIQLEERKAELTGEIMEANNQFISPDEATKFNIDEQIYTKSGVKIHI